MERWGVFSVIDHKDDIRLAIELLLYDKIAVPTPMDDHGPDWQRWERNGWDPAKLMKRVAQLKKNALVVEAEWDLDRQKNWQKAFSETKAEIDKVSDELKRDLEAKAAVARVEVERTMADRTEADRARAIEAAAYAETRNEVIKHLKGTTPIWYGPIEFYAAYQSRADFEAMHPADDAVKQGVERVNFLIRHQLAVPDEAPEKLLAWTIETATSEKFKKRRRLFYDWQRNLVERRYDPARIVVELDSLVRDFNQD